MQYNISPQQMEKMMRQMGIKNEKLDASEVIIRLKNGNDIVVSSPGVQRITMNGEVSFQVTGNITERGAGPSEDDVAIVAEKAKVSKDAAKKALEDAKGDIAEAILSLQKE